MGETAVDEFFYLKFLFKLPFLVRFLTWKWLFSKKIMPLSATLPLIGLKCFWFLMALLLYPKSTILGLPFLDPKDLCLPNQFSTES